MKLLNYFSLLEKMLLLRSKILLIISCKGLDDIQCFPNIVLKYMYVNKQKLYCIAYYIKYKPNNLLISMQCHLLKPSLRQVKYVYKYLFKEMAENCFLYPEKFQKAYKIFNVL